jgi:hypothetical protein
LSDYFFGPAGLIDTVFFGPDFALFADFEAFAEEFSTCWTFATCWTPEAPETALAIENYPHSAYRPAARKL